MQLVPMNYGTGSDKLCLGRAFYVETCCYYGFRRSLGVTMWVNYLMLNEYCVIGLCYKNLIQACCLLVAAGLQFVEVLFTKAIWVQLD